MDEDYTPVLTIPVHTLVLTDTVFLAGGWHGIRRLIHRSSELTIAETLEGTWYILPADDFISVRANEEL